MATPDDPAPPDCKILPAANSGSETSGDGEPVRAESGAASQTLTGPRRIRAVSEGSMPPTGQAAPVLSGDGGAEREGESTSAW